MFGAVPVVAQPVPFDIPSELASKSIPELARQADVQILGPGETLKSITTPEVKGTFDVTAALEMMLKGTDLTVGRTAKGVITISLKKKNCNEEGDTMSRNPKNTVSVIALLFGALTTPACMAQSAPTSDTNEMETVVVTGTLIRGVETPTGSNLVNIGATDIKASGVTTAMDLLNQNIPQLGFFNTVQTGSANFGSAVPKILLRGIQNSGASATLVLFNGHRVVPMGVLSTEPDPELIPADVIQSVQVMPDGGSATYGSDAVGGVVNFVTRTHFDGVQVHAQDSIGDGYNEFNVSLTAGKSWDGGSAYISVLHNNHNALFGKDRDFVTENFTAHGGNDNRGTACDYGVISPNGTTTKYLGSTFAAATTLPRCDRSDNTSFYPAETRNSIFAYAEQQLTKSLKFSVDGYWSKREDKIYIDSNAFGSTLTITNTNPYWHAVGTETSQTVAFGLARAIGPYRITPQDFTQYQVTPVLTWDVDGNWEVRSSLTYGQSTSNIHDRSGVNGNLISSATFDPYDPSVTPGGVIDSITNFEIYSQGINTVASAQVVADGKVWTLPGGDVHLAVGGEIRRQTLHDVTYTGTIGSSNPSTGGIFPAGRTIKAGFAELLVPIVGAGNALAGVQKLSLDLAVRYDDYSDFGGTTNPRIGIDYAPIDDLIFRANFQTTFDAPSLADSGNKVDTRFQFRSFAPNYRIFLAGAGENLKPTTGTTFSVGGDYTPHAIDGLKMGVTYWNTTLKNMISQALSAYGSSANALSTSYNLCGTAGTPVNGVCTLAYLQSLQPQYIRIDASGTPGINTLQDILATGTLQGVLDARRKNFGGQKISGLDFDASYSRDVSFGSVFAQVNGTYILSKRFEARPGAVWQDQIAGITINGQTPEYSIVGAVGASVGPYTGRIQVNHTAGYHIPTGTAVGQTDVDPFTVVNLYLSADLGKLAILDENELTLSINNIMDQAPPYFGVQQTLGQSVYTGFNPATGSTLGRMFIIGLRSKF